MAKILIASADGSLSATVARAYRLTGHSVTEARDAAACMSSLEKKPADAFVLDPHLPGLEASGLLRHVRRNPALSGMRISLLAHDMDAALFSILGELKGRPDVRAVIWRGEGKSFSSGRDTSAIGTLQLEMTHHELMRRGHRGIQQLWEIDAPVIVACKGWVMGGSFQRAMLL